MLIYKNCSCRAIHSLLALHLLRDIPSDTHMYGSFVRRIHNDGGHSLDNFKRVEVHEGNVEEGAVEKRER